LTPAPDQDGPKRTELHADPLFRLPALEGEPVFPRVLVSTYYDNDAGTLTRSGITLRRRQEQQTAGWRLELPAEEGRIELEEAGSLDAVPDAFQRLLAAHLQRGRLTPVAILRTHRAGVITGSGAGRVQVIHDRVQVLDGAPGVADFARIRIELLSGSNAAFDDAVATLLDAGAERTHRRDAKGLVPGLPTPEARGRRAWLTEQVDDILANDPGTRLGVDAEHLHAHRVAVRRLRAALREEPLKSELGWIGGALGAVRDLDVLTDRLQHEADVLDAEERAAFRPILSRLARRRTRARAELTEALDSPRYFQLLDELEGQAAESKESRRELAAEASRQFRRLRREVALAGLEPPDEVLHELRKRAKRIRYAAERARRAGAPKMGKVIECARALQDVLGASQDAVVAEHELRDLAGETAAPVRAIAVGRLIERERSLREAAVAEWPAAWHRLERAGEESLPRPPRKPKREPESDPAPAPAAESESESLAEHEPRSAA
jgi:CHAD domain-containing protein